MVKTRIENFDFVVIEISFVVRQEKNQLSVASFCQQHDRFKLLVVLNPTTRV